MYIVGVATDHQCLFGLSAAELGECVALSCWRPAGCRVGCGWPEWESVDGVAAGQAGIDEWVDLKGGSGLTRLGALGPDILGHWACPEAIYRH
ncbi:hypothetical protein Tco_0557025 [Tanacetum coccineum]